MLSSYNVQPVESFDITLADLPGSKSLTNRALLLASLAEGESVIRRVLEADDTKYMLGALEQLGFAPKYRTAGAGEVGREVTVVGKGGDVPVGHAELFLGNAGTAYRFLTASLGLSSERGAGYVLKGIERMNQRPIGQLVDAIRALSGKVEYVGKEGFPPVRVYGGGMRGGKLKMKATLSSQYISALLQVGAYCEEGLEIEFDGAVTSRPYVEMTLELMARFGVKAEVEEGLKRVVVLPGCYCGTEYDVEPDASNASYFLAAAAVTPGGRCTIEGLGKRSLQGDVGFADVLHQMGAGLLFGGDFITVMGPGRGEKLKGVDVDLNAMPDMAQTLAVAALFAEGETVIRNVGNLRVKETDRLAALETELRKFGAKVEVEGDDLRIEPPGKVCPPREGVATYDDHRMAMSFAIAGLRVPGVQILDPACVNKTFPEYFKYLERLGA